MRRTLWTILLLLAACTGSGGETSDGGLPPGTIVARFAPGGDVSVIEIVANETSALRQAELVAPTGQVIPAYSIDTVRSPQRETFQPSPSMGVGVGIGSSGRVGTGVGLSFPIGGLGTQTTTAVGQIASTALLRIPDPVFYRQTWRDWKLRLRFGDPPSDVRFVNLDAPAPPA